MKSVHAGQLRQVSASQISKFDSSQQGGCNRRWYFDKVLGISEPSTKGQETGTSIHSEIEHYLLTGENTLGRVALAGLQFIPSRDLTMSGFIEVEHDLKDCVIAGVPLTGRIDLLNNTPFWIDEDGVTQRQDAYTLEVVDWKTTSNLKYRKAGEDLLDTVQMPVYAYHSAQPEHLNTKQVRLSHVYFQTKGKPQAAKSTALFSLDEITERYHAIERVVELMKQAARLPSVTDLEPNPASCYAFNRECVYSEQCPRNQAVMLGLHFGTNTEGDSTMGLFDNLVKAPATKPVTNGISPHKVETIQAQANAQETQSNAAQVRAEMNRLMEEERALKAFGIVPPDAKPSEGPATYEPEPTSKAQSGLFDAPKGFTQPTQPAQPKEAHFDTTPQDEIFAAHASPIASTLELYVNCAVVGVDVQPLQPIINKACEEIERQYNTPDIRLGKEPLAYGGWKAVLATVLRGYNLDGRFSISGSGDIINAAVEALERQAVLVVKGL